MKPLLFWIYEQDTLKSADTAQKEVFMSKALLKTITLLINSIKMSKALPKTMTLLINSSNHPPIQVPASF